MSMRVVLVLLMAMWAWAQPVQAAPLKACADRAEMPPFSYLDRSTAGEPQHVVGATVELLQKLLKPSGQELKLELLPWARCLTDVQSGRLQLALNVGRSEADANQLLIGKPFFQLHMVYLVSRSAHPQPLLIKDLHDLSQHQVCGLGGYRYEDLGLDTRKVDRGTTQSYEQLITKLHLGRCDVVVDSRELLGGMYLVNPTLRKLLFDGRLLIRPLPGAPVRDLFIGISPKMPQATLLMQTLDEGLSRMIKTRDVDHLLERYFE